MKAEADTVERSRAWAEAKAKEKAEIARVNTEARDRAREEAKARVWEKNDAVQRAAAEASVRIISKAETRRAKRDRA